MVNCPIGEGRTQGLLASSGVLGRWFTEATPDFLEVALVWDFVAQGNDRTAVSRLTYASHGGFHLSWLTQCSGGSSNRKGLSTTTSPWVFLESVSAYPANGNPRTGLLRTFWERGSEFLRNPFRGLCVRGAFHCPTKRAFPCTL